jgi:Zn finger protein HypA/HybF involved in hydrogenase expression
VNQERFKTLQIRLSGLSNWLITLAVIGILVSIGLGWLVKGILILIVVIAVTPILLIWGVQWWLKRNLIQDQCPVCSHEFPAFNTTQFQCPNCGEPLKIEQGHFIRLTPPGTIDVQAVDVSVQQLED